MNRCKLRVVPLASLFLIAFAASDCSTVSAPTGSPEKESLARILESYAAAMETGDYSKVRFTADVTFLGPLTGGPIVGEGPVRNFLLQVSRDVREIRVKRRVIDGEFACVIAELETKNGVVVPFCEFFRVVEGRIAEIHPYFDPRPLVR